MYDATVIPSYLGATTRGSMEGSEDLLGNFALRYGEVKKIYHKDHELNFSKLHTEYEVEVQHRDGVGITSTTTYRGVAASNLLGGLADKFEVTYRADTKQNTEGAGNGSKVLLLCISGDQSKAVILGGYSESPHEDTTHHMTLQFNGFRLHVNKDGEAELLFRGATNADGSRKGDEDADGSYLRFSKDGTVTVSGPGGEQYIKIDQTNRKMEIQADTGGWTVSSRQDATINAAQQVAIDAADGYISLTSSDGTIIGLGTDFMILGDTYRQAEGLANQTVSKALAGASTAGIAASAALMTAAGLNAIPMVGGIAAAPFLITAATQLQIHAQALNVASQALNTFENNYDKYLSRNNKND